MLYQSLNYSTQECWVWDWDGGSRPLIFGTKDYKHGINGEKVSLGDSSECLSVKV